MKLELVKYRDIGMTTYTYFWVNERGTIISPFFDNEQEAAKWVTDNGYNDASVYGRTDLKDSGS